MLMSRTAWISHSSPGPTAPAASHRVRCRSAPPALLAFLCVSSVMTRSFTRSDSSRSVATGRVWICSSRVHIHIEISWLTSWLTCRKSYLFHQVRQLPQRGVRPRVDLHLLVRLVALDAREILQPVMTAQLVEHAQQQRTHLQVIFVSMS